MSHDAQPLVSVLTPLYNNAEHLAQCIESVLSQTYWNWEYLIVNNCSTDESGAIARRYAAQDPRIRVHDNATFLSALANHNFALCQGSRSSKYCKLVFGDDWIFPTCLEQMVAVAEQYPSAGIVGAYGLEGGAAELDSCVEDRLAEYYNFLAVSLILRRGDAKFWAFHKAHLIDCGVGFSRLRLLGAILARFLKAGLNPARTIEKLRS